MLHFTKDDDAFSRFALEILHTNKEIRKLKQIGVDMESVIYNGFKHHFPNLGRRLCVRHLSKRDESKLSKLLAKTNLNASQKNKSSFDILKDIYGYRIGAYYEYGLAEATNESDLDIKLLSLKEKWNGLCPGFYDWFLKKWRLDFVDRVIQSTREGSDVQGLYFQNDVEFMHFLEKLNQDFKKESIAIAIESLSQIAERQNLEEIRAIFLRGRYVLSQQYKQISVESSVWHSWSEERRMDYIKKFREYIPSISNSFSKPSNSGQQKRNHKRQELDIVIDRHEATTSESLAAVSQASSPSQSQAAVLSGSESQATSEG